MGLRPIALGGVHAQLVLLLDAARADGSAKVLVSAGPSAIELTFAEGGIFAEAGRDASRTGVSTLTAEDEIVLEILGWRRDNSRDSFMRRWHVETPSDDIADDILRTAENAYRCASVGLKLLLAAPAPVLTPAR
jgi:hypothetical protein